jgi:hypothetical protein
VVLDTHNLSNVRDSVWRLVVQAPNWIPAAGSNISDGSSRACEFFEFKMLILEFCYLINCPIGQVTYQILIQTELFVADLTTTGWGKTDDALTVAPRKNNGILHATFSFDTSWKLCFFYFGTVCKNQRSQKMRLNHTCSCIWKRMH